VTGLLVTPAPVMPAVGDLWLLHTDPAPAGRAVDTRLIDVTELVLLAPLLVHVLTVTAPIWQR